MDPVTLILTGISVAKGLASLAVDVGPMITNIKSAVDALFGGGHITDVQAADLRTQTSELEGEWAVALAAARAEPPAA